MSNIIFGPIHSRRFGKSLGVDLSPGLKQCNFDCLYCELAPAKTVDSYDEVISVQEIVSAIRSALMEYGDIDVLTITANGEPTLYPHLDKLMDEIDKFKEKTKTLILSNASTISDTGIRKTLLKFDQVKLSLDCVSQKCLKKLDRSHSDIDIEDIKKGLLDFAKLYNQALIIEVLFVKKLNDSDTEIKGLNNFLLKLSPARIDIGTIDRPPAYNVKPLNYRELLEISHKFDPDLPVYIALRKKLDAKTSSYTTNQILDTLAKRPLTKSDIDMLFDKDSKKRLTKMLSERKIKETDNHGVIFYTIS
ncbi:MAG: radical SAM protein [Sulfurovum sp.]|nr:radical SAM protein [Sulfurovum sp.]